MRKTKRYIALLLLGAMLLSLLAGCASSDQSAPSEQPTQPPVETHYGENSVTAMSNYAITTASPDDEIMTAVVAVDAERQPLLNNRMLQICYWIEFYGFMSNYGAYAIYFGLDSSKPLAEQTSIDGQTTWEQYFLQAAAQHFNENYALAQAAYAEGYVLPENDEAMIADIAAPDGDFAAEAAEAGYDSPDAYIKANFGDGVTVQDYQDYLRTFYAAMDYYEQIKTAVTDGMTDEMAEAYFDENAETYAENRIEKKNNVTVRHILIAPEGDKDATLNDWTAEQWAAAEEKANEVYDLWKQDPTEEHFAELAGEYTDDPGSKETGGLYEDFATNAMVEPFSDWCFADGRVAGDTGIVRTEFGFHIMYFVQMTGTRAWLDTAREDAVNDGVSERINELCETYPARFDYTLVRIFDMVSKMAEENTPQG